MNATAGTRSPGPAGKAARPQAVLPYVVGWVLYCANVELTVWQVISPVGPPASPLPPASVATNKYPGYVSAPTLGTLDDSYDKFTFRPVSTTVLLYVMS